MNEPEAGYQAKYHEGEFVDIGHGHKYRFVYMDDIAVGIDEVHASKSGSGQPCAGWIPFTGRTVHSTSWELLSEKPLTLSPSLLCACGEHGFIRNNRWEVA